MGNAQLKEVDNDGEDFVDELKPGTELMHGQYVIEKFLNAGGFGITYLAKDSLDRKIVIKECFPGAFCRRSKTIVNARSRAHQPELKSIVRLFVQEARSLAKLQHPNIVGVHQVFEDNETAYMALDFVEGRDLLETLEDPNHGLTPPQIKSMLTDILGAVGFVHEQGMLHRDISPDNILIDANLRPVLIDFGAAREQATKQSRVLSALRVVKDGYSPQEFYIAGSPQNESSDLYALGASFYHLIADEVPPNSQARLAAIATGDNDPYVPLADNVKGYDREFLAALDMSLRILPKDRVQTAQDWLDMMDGKKPIVLAATPVLAKNGADKKKSRMPMLMASVAVVALLGVLVATQTDVLDSLKNAPVEAAAVNTVEPQAIEAPAIEAPAPVAAPAEEAAAPIVVEDTAPTLAATADGVVVASIPDVTPVAPAVEEQVVLSEPILPAPTLADASPAIDIETTVAALPEPIVLDTVSPHSETIFTPVAAPVVEQVALVLELAGPPITGPVAQALPPVELKDLVASTARPMARPEFLVMIPQPTPEIIRDAAVTPSLPGFLAGAQDIPSSTTPVLALPEAPVDVALEAVAMVLDVPALIPGNEIIQVAAVIEAEDAVPAVEDVAVAEEAFAVEEVAVIETAPAVADPGVVLADWSVKLPFTASPTQPNTIGDVALVAPSWVSEGVSIKAVNGTAVDSIDDIQNILNQTITLTEAAKVNVTFDIEADGVSSTHDWSMPIEQNFELLNGMTFNARNENGTWLTTVTAIPESVDTDMVVGDELIAYMVNAAKFETRWAVKDMFDGEVAAGKTRFSFAVDRDEAMWVAGMEYNPNFENEEPGAALRNQ